ncbi:MAG: flavodoxin-dependent (E)-4-hydroxy-3-methylbut-2-enyl-diphosphate synthase [Christensenellaceae bacterium]|nr:flavodoxin-dependent (E)-4-hydroxy-3-methylbut-2-enyl-diphosphate synthase [Christensenellaceae bacterium]
MTNKVKIGKLYIGGGEKVAIQSMTNTDTADVAATVAQIHRLEQAGCEIIRASAYDENSARAFKDIKKEISIPLVADVHFDYRIAIAAIESGADKVRINPGNIGSSERIRSVADAAKAHGVPIRVGANSGSLAKHVQSMPLHQALVESALENVRLLEQANFGDIVISLKASNVSATVKACRLLAEKCSYPQHLGVTEAGIYSSSVIKSSMGIGSLLMDGIGDTIRVSITGDPVTEVGVAKDILRFAGARSFGPEVVSCPTCARTRIDIEAMAEKVSDLVKDMDKPLKIAVMGCAVNGPGEARDADIGIAGGDGEGLLFVKGKPVKKVSEEVLFDAFKALLEEVAREA